MFFPKRHLQKFAEALSDVVGEPHRDDIIVIGRKDWLRYLLQVVLDGLILANQDQTRLVQRVTAKNAAHCIGDQLAHGVGQQPSRSHQFLSVSGRQINSSNIRM